MGELVRYRSKRSRRKLCLCSRNKPHRQSGRPWIENCRVLEVILSARRSGARWQDLPDKYLDPATCWRRLRPWQEQGPSLKIWRAFLRRKRSRRSGKKPNRTMGGSGRPPYSFGKLPSPCSLGLQRAFQKRTGCSVRGTSVDLFVVVVSFLLYNDVTNSPMVLSDRPLVSHC